MTADSFGAKGTLQTSQGALTVHRLSVLEKAGLAPDLGRMPFSIRVLLEAVLRNVDGELVSADDVKNLAAWNAPAPKDVELPYMPARVILQDFTGVPAVVDLASMRAAVKRLGGDPRWINPLVPVDLVVDHSVQVDYFGSKDALEKNAQLEFERNRERYEFLRWGQKAFQNFRVVPPATGIVHQVNLEYLAKVVLTKTTGGETLAFPDTLVGTDSHTTMVNGLGVLGWGVGGIEAEAVMLGQPLYMVTPQVVGMKLHGQLREGVTATDLVLTVTQVLRKKGVVEKFVEFFGPGLAEMPLADRATIANMAPGVRRHLRLLPGGRRDAALPAHHRPHARPRSTWSSATEGAGALPHRRRPRPRLHRHARAGSVRGRADRSPGRSGRTTACPSRQMKDALQQGPRRAREGARLRPGRGRPRPHRIGRGARRPGRARPRRGGHRRDHELHQHLEPVGDAGRGPARARRRRRAASRCRGYVKTSLAPGSKVVTEYLDQTGLSAGPERPRLRHRRLRLHDLHRQQRSASARGLEGGERRQARGLRRALGQPELRGPHQPRREGQLPGLARRWSSPTRWPGRTAIDLTTRAARDRTRTASR